MVHKTKSRQVEIEWGFDFIQLKSEKLFLKLLKDFGFVKVSSKAPEGWEIGRFKESHTTWANPAGIRITVQNMGGKGEDKGNIGYVGITAPKDAETELKRFLAGFRGKKKVSGLDVMTTGGITTYVKQENAYENPYITVL